MPTASSARPSTISQYSGRRCAASADFSAWRADGPIKLDRVLRSRPDPELVRRATSYLAALAYLPEGFGAPDAAKTMVALREFRNDAELRTSDDGDITADDIAALRSTIKRSNRGTTCSVPARSRFSACETSSF
jgi:hypothetical protein